MTVSQADIAEALDMARKFAAAAVHTFSFELLGPKVPELWQGQAKQLHVDDIERGSKQAMNAFEGFANVAKLLTRYAEQLDAQRRYEQAQAAAAAAGNPPNPFGNPFAPNPSDPFGRPF